MNSGIYKHFLLGMKINLNTCTPISQPFQYDSFSILSVCLTATVNRNKTTINKYNSEKWPL